MKNFTLTFMLSALMSIQTYPVIFNGLIESGITKNNFLCSAPGEQDCSNADSGAIGFNLTTSQSLQFFNNQSFWLRQQAAKESDLVTNQNYSGSALTDKMVSEGWVAMGGYCVLISADPMLADVVMPLIKTTTSNQVKVVVQLWYNGDQQMQLWSQDAAILSVTQSFQVTISSDIDSQVSLLPSLESQTSFLGQIGLQQNNRQPAYAHATGCPRMVKINIFS